MSAAFERFKKKLLEAKKAGTIGPMASMALQRPDDFDELPPASQWAMDKKLGILDWDGDISK